MIVVRTAGCRGDQRLMIPEYRLISQIEVIVTVLSGFRRIALMFSQRIVKGGIQMVILSTDPHNIPGVTVFDPFLRIVAADSDYTPHTQRITKHLHRFGNTLADAYPLSQRSDNLMGIRLFNLS